MKLRKIPWRWLLAGVVAFLAAGIAAPFLSADMFGQRIKQALEASLGRPASGAIGKVRFNLFQGRFAISRAEIGGGPGLRHRAVRPGPGGESSTHALKLKSLVDRQAGAGPPAPESPVVNLVKVGAAGTRGHSRPSWLRRCRIEVREGRIDSSSATPSPSSHRMSSWTQWPFLAAPPTGTCKFRGEPARTDGPSQRIRPAEPEWQRHTGGLISVNFDLRSKGRSVKVSI
jgi:hypothetical protein